MELLITLNKDASECRTLSMYPRCPLFRSFTELPTLSILHPPSPLSSSSSSSSPLPNLLSGSLLHWYQRDVPVSDLRVEESHSVLSENGDYIIGSPRRGTAAPTEVDVAGGGVWTEGGGKGRREGGRGRHPQPAC